MSDVLKLMATLFENRALPFREVEHRRELEVSYDVGWTAWKAYAKDDDGILLFRSVVPRLPPEGRRLAVAEYLTRANFNLRVGNFEMDFADGETRFKTSLDLRGEPPTEPLLAGVVAHNVEIFLRYRKELDAVIEGTMTPEEAIIEAESD